jgi:hypothetical protein
MKTYLASILILFMAFALVGCGAAAAQRNLADTSNAHDTAKALWQQCIDDPKCPPDELARDKQRLDEADLEYDRARGDVIRINQANANAVNAYVQHNNFTPQPVIIVAPPPPITPIYIGF